MWRRRVRELLSSPRSALDSRLAVPRPARAGAARRPVSADLRARLRLPPVAEPPAPGGAASRGGTSWRLYSSVVSPEVGAAGPQTCWNCGAAAPPEPFLVCGACGGVQPVDSSIDFFKIFGLEREYELSVEELENKYKFLQKKLHPDIVHTKSERERSHAADQSARVINAFTTLSRPLSRAIYMLQLEGLLVEEEGTVSDPDLLAEVMEIREAVEDADDVQTLEQIKSTSEEKLKLWSNSFGGALKDRRLKDAVDSIRRMTYYQRAIEEIVKKL